MRRLVAILIAGGCLSLWAGAAAASATVQLHCSDLSCQYTEEIGPDGTKSYQGYCDGTGNTKVTEGNSDMDCHKAKDLTCTFANFEFPDDKHPYWSCTCTNWNATHEAHPAINITCPAPS